MERLVLPFDDETGAELSVPGEGAGETDAQLVRALRRADPDALVIAYRRHAAGVWRYLVRRTGDPHTADDLLGEVFLAAVRRLPRFRWSGIPLRHWLLRVASGKVGEWWRCRRRSRWREFGEELERSLVAEDVEQLPEHDLWRVALSSLDERYQCVLVLYYLEELSVEEVAQVIGCRRGTVKSRLHRARLELRRILGEEGLDVDG
ncbi:MAG: sigma-70 family RNA polymerase sigma factor [Planctomycetes bacterium]|nr:sigma-70 family RNA polymerase sigma factor [Planctomycetota bacterium]